MTSVTSCEELKKEVKFEIHIPKTSKDKIKAHQFRLNLEDEYLSFKPGIL